MTNTTFPPNKVPFMTNTSFFSDTLSFLLSLSVQCMAFRSQNQCGLHQPKKVKLQEQSAAHCNTLQHVVCTQNQDGLHPPQGVKVQHTATHCNKLQRTATHYNTLQRTATHCNTLQHTATHCICAKSTWTTSNPRNELQSIKSRLALSW